MEVSHNQIFKFLLEVFLIEQNLPYSRQYSNSDLLLTIMAISVRQHTSTVFDHSHQLALPIEGQVVRGRLDETHDCFSDHKAREIFLSPDILDSVFLEELKLVLGALAQRKEGASVEQVFDLLACDNVSELGLPDDGAETVDQSAVNFLVPSELVDHQLIDCFVEFAGISIAKF